MHLLAHFPLYQFSRMNIIIYLVFPFMGNGSLLSKSKLFLSLLAFSFENYYILSLIGETDILLSFKVRAFELNSGTSFLFSEKNSKITPLRSFNSSQELLIFLVLPCYWSLTWHFHSEIKISFPSSNCTLGAMNVYAKLGLLFSKGMVFTYICIQFFCVDVQWY